MGEATLPRKPASHKRQQVAVGLRALIATLSPGDRLPTVAELERHFGVATGTVVAAIGMLRREGTVVGRRGSGTYVAQPARPAARGYDSGGQTAASTLAVLTPSQNPFYRHCMDEMTVHAERRGLKVVCHYGNREMSFADALDLEALRPVGYLLFNYNLAPVASALLQRGHHAVVIGIPKADVVPAVPCVYGDHEHGAHLAARRLLDLGHRRIAFVDEFVNTDLPQRRRWRSHEQTLREAGVTRTDTIIGRQRLQAWRDDPDAVRRYFGDPDAPTGLVVWSDATAVGVLHLLRQAGLSVPEDISVIGYDNLPLGMHSHPSLDTVDSHVDVQIRHALNLLSSPMAPGAISTAVVTPTLLCRHSCARPRE